MAGQMRAALVIAGLVAAGASLLAAPVAIEGPIDAFGAKLAKLRSVHLTFTHANLSNGAETQKAEFEVWFDKESGQYLAVDEWRQTVHRGGAQRTWGTGVLADAKGALTWYVQNGQPQNCYLRLAEEYCPGEDRLPVNNYARGCVLDALYGYKNLSRVFSAKPGPCPLADHKELRWFSVQVNDGTAEADRLRWLTQQGCETSFGFDPESGWLRAVVTGGPGGQWRSVTILAGIEENPDTKGVFVLPAGVDELPVLDPRTGQPVPR